MLIATPAIGDPRFDRSVIMVCAHSADHAMGIIINQPLGGLKLEDLFEQLDIKSSIKLPDQTILNGGPVDRDRGFVLHSDDYETPDSTLALPADLRLTATKDILEAIAEDRGSQRQVMALGYAGWGPGQLDHEIRENAWLTCPPDRDLVFSPAFDEKWEQALDSLGVSPAMMSSLSGKA